MKAVVSAGDAQTAAAGADLLAEGGNAIDAVVGAAFASWVVEPPLGSAAGAGILLHGSRDGYELIDFFTRVPGLGLPPVDPQALDFYPIDIDFGPTTQAFHIGRGSVALPTAVWGLVDTHARHGRLPLSVVAEPARKLASEGWVLSSHLYQVLRFLEPILTISESVRTIHCVDGEIPPAGTTMYNHGLGRLFEGIAAEGRKFLDGPYRAAMLEDFGPDAGGRLTPADLDSIGITTRPPLRTPFAGHTVLTPSPPATGGSLVALSLQLAERHGLAELEWMSPAWAERIVKIMHVTSVARAAGFDEDVFREGAAERLLSRDWWSQIAQAEERNRGETTHISVIDAEGHAASFTQSNGEGCGHTLERFGVHLNNFLGEEDINPRGFHGQPAGSKLTTMMTPTIVLDDRGEPVFVVGSGGANRIRSAVFMAIANRIAHRRSIHESANAPRIHVEGQRLWWEHTGAMKHNFSVIEAALADPVMFPDFNMFFGGVNVVGIEGGDVVGAGDERRGGRAVGI